MIRLLLIALLLSFPAVAADAPLPAHKTGSMEELQKEMAAQKEQRAKISVDMKTAEKEFKETKEKLVSTAETIRQNEVKLNDLETGIASLSAEETQIKSTLESDYGSLASLILALERMRRLPPELLIVRPGAPLQSAQTATLLHSLLPSLSGRTQELSERLKRLAEIRDTMTRDRKAAMQTRETLRRDYIDITSLTAKREEIYKNLNKDYASTQAEIDKIARETKSMQEFMDRLAAQEEEERRREEDEQKRSAKPKASRALAWSMPKAGKPQLPVAGTLLTDYGKQDSIGAISKGITLRTAPSAIVVAPMGGIVKFSGSFLHYGRMVIIEHPKGYHSLIAGLEDINVSAGLTIAAGEPIGKLPATSSRGDAPTLYYELRFRGQPVNPSKAFADLRS